MNKPLSLGRYPPAAAHELYHHEQKPSAVESMADDIAAHGLLQNLVAYEDEGLFYVFAGGRRYRGLKELAKRKQIKKTEPVRCVIDTVNDASEISLDENVTREDLSPADQFERFRELDAHVAAREDAA